MLITTKLTEYIAAAFTGIWIQTGEPDDFPVERRHQLGQLLFGERRDPLANA